MTVITLPNRRQISVACYVASWRKLLTVPPQTSVTDWDHFPTPAADILAAFSRGVHDRINRHLSWFGRGRKWQSDWYWETWRASRDLNQPRLRIHWLPAWLKPRFSHRLCSHED